ncbi:hypothetical protein IE81DRAFT_345837 [Ceraceosorus guamensis]|uniref:Uncharacterized protein n=1 Tax=Ceraceosorus guamensis TaxID=1522189 RepID=A0A316W342_9BASI|nr:hypothetical protein IE81DRAFT_345837 [Ceraceosorus guamensis]PWN44132.1 hypothetical protein IE81DRAFT_345837 [Ceraceosorus guamensis]
MSPTDGHHHCQDKLYKVERNLARADPEITHQRKQYNGKMEPCQPSFYAAHLADIHLGSIQQMFVAAAYLSAGMASPCLRNLIGTPRLKDAQASAQIAFEDASTVDSNSLKDVFVVARSASRIIAYERLLETTNSGLSKPIFHLWRLGMIGNAALLCLEHFQALQTTLMSSLLLDPTRRTIIHFGMIRLSASQAYFVLPRTTAAVLAIAEGIYEADFAAENLIND